MSTYIDQLLDTVTDIEAERASQYAEHDVDDTSADDIADMHDWAAKAEAERAFARLMQRAHGLIDRAYMSSKVGYAQSAIATAQRALTVTTDAYAVGEANHLIGEATRLIDRLNNNYAAAKGRY
ncbi:hypothetical protein [Mycolicibacterium nivoides]|uniref:hypothetical protein n=1 Tax=Mycolicibacterium nivoides TaxID=2487344 RepID=UPI000F5C2751|nr:hypothetical protein [Mycolicibacterium nivoides]